MRGEIASARRITVRPSSLTIGKFVTNSTRIVFSYTQVNDSIRGGRQSSSVLLPWARFNAKGPTRMGRVSDATGLLPRCRLVCHGLGTLVPCAEPESALSECCMKESLCGGVLMTMLAV